MTVILRLFNVCLYGLKLVSQSDKTKTEFLTTLLIILIPVIVLVIVEIIINIKSAISKRSKNEDLYLKDNFTPSQNETDPTKQHYSYTEIKDRTESIIKSIQGTDELLYKAIERTYMYKPVCPEMLMQVLNISFARSVELMHQICDVGVGRWYGDKREYYKVYKWNEWENYICSLSTTDIKYIERVIYNRNHVITDSVKLRNVTYDDVENELDRIDNMDGFDFEDWVAEVLEKNGFNDVTVTERSKDKGVDIFATKVGKKYAFQCKCYSSAVGNKSVQEIFTGKAIYGCDYGVVVTNAWLTEDAVEMAKVVGVQIWDREALVPYVKTYLESKN